MIVKFFKLIKRYWSILLSAVKNFKDPWWRAKKKYIKYYDELPIDDKCILLESEHGKKISGNIFYICKYLSQSEEYKDYKIYVSTWGRYEKGITNLLASQNITNFSTVIYVSDEYFRVLASAKYLINDTSFHFSFIKKPGQIYLNTWHGTPLKALGRKMNSDFAGIGNIQANFADCDYILFPNKCTRDSIMKDYMIENLVEPIEVFSGYPRNEIFFDKEAAFKVREKYDLTEKKVYAYLPTFRGAVNVGGTDKSDAYLKYFLYELDKLLGPDEVLFVNLHPLAKKSVNFRDFKNIRQFPGDVETYAFLNSADCLITDYSSVFFDFVNSGRKIVLFTYDREDYLGDRGMYMEMDDLPFPKVTDLESLINELRTPVNYDCSGFKKEYCLYETPDASRNLCDFVIKGLNHGVVSKKNHTNGKENVVIHVGNLAGNGITRSIKTLLSSVDLDERNYYISFKRSAVKNNESNLRHFSEKVGYFPLSGDMNLTIWDQIVRKLFKEKIITAKLYAASQKKRLQQEWKRCYGSAKFDTAIQFNGYQDDMTLLYGAFCGRKYIYAHNDMTQEISLKGNSRKDVLSYAYSTYDRVAMVSEDIVAPNSSIVGKGFDNYCVCRNIINYETIIENSTLEPAFDEFTKVFPDREKALALLDSGAKKFVTVGRFSPEKGHLRLLDAFKKIAEENNDVLLVIIGGVSSFDYYGKTIEHATELGIEDKVILILNVTNPYAIMKKCDYFVLSSLYEGFGIVIAEADILGLPVVSTDINGPRTFMNEHGGTLVESSTEGLEKGLRLMLEGKVAPMNVDYKKYNNEAIEEFYQMLNYHRA